MHNSNLAQTRCVAGVIAALSVGLATSAAPAAVLSVANWNLGNRPNTAADTTNLETVLGHMKTIGGRALDLLAVVETDAASAATTLTSMQAVNGTSTYASLVSSADGGSDRTAFFYNTSTLSLLDSTELASSSLTHRTLRAHLQPVGGAAGTDFYIYTVHLKSGETSAIRATRADEASILRADANALGNANVIFVGDFNWQGDQERGATLTSAFQVFNASGNGQVFDPVNAVGAWRDNAGYLSLHTNDPGGAMDDRFDMQLVSGELQDGTGIDYLASSYRVIGNNGTHTLNDTILTGTGAPSDVLNALYNLSDHLPVFAQYDIAVPEPTAVLFLVTGFSLSRRRR